MTHTVEGRTLAVDVRALLDERAACVARVSEIDGIVAEIRAALGIPADLVELRPVDAAAALHVVMRKHGNGDAAVPPARPSVPATGGKVNPDLSINDDQLSITEQQIVKCVRRHTPKAVKPSQISVEAVIPYNTVNDRLPRLLRLGVLQRGAWGKYKLGEMRVNWTSSGPA